MSFKKHLNIICFTVPYPVDYGGVFDLFYKIKSLYEAGVAIHLHCFDYGRGHQKELEKYCIEVYYYKRKNIFSCLFSSLPYIVISRKNEMLFKNLLRNDYPILMEGIQSSYLINDKRFNSRKKFIRLHNIESDYYKDIAENEQNLLKKVFYKRESRLLFKYESRVSNKAVWITISQKDAGDYKKKFPLSLIYFIPLFLPGWKVTALPGKGSYCLYQGDLSVASNHKMAEALIKKFYGTKMPLIIAGKKPSSRLQVSARQKNISLIADPTNQKMQELIQHAQVNIVPSMSATGIKLKLLNALYNGRHCVVNENSVKGTGLESLCTITNDENILIEAEKLFATAFPESMLLKRKDILHRLFNNKKNADALIQKIWG